MKLDELHNPVPSVKSPGITEGNILPTFSIDNLAKLLRQAFYPVTSFLLGFSK